MKEERLRRSDWGEGVGEVARRGDEVRENEGLFWAAARYHCEWALPRCPQVLRPAAASGWSPQATVSSQHVWAALPRPPSSLCLQAH